MRKGMMKGSGKRGYHNIIGKDPMVHSQSAKGIKQPQRLSSKRYHLNQLRKGIIRDEKPYFIVRSFTFDEGSRKMDEAEMKKFAKETLKYNHKIDLDTEVNVSDLNDSLNAWVYLRNIGMGEHTNIKGSKDGKLYLKGDSQ